MSKKEDLTRRGFLTLCASAAVFVGRAPQALAGDDGAIRRYHRVGLVDRNRHPVTAQALETGQSYVFHYPFVTTPCLLVDIGERMLNGEALRTEAGATYRWRGGVGPHRSIVAYSAICSHRMTHPARAVSFINYRHETVRFRDGGEDIAQRAHVIYCCSENSVYDAADGARVLGGPAPQPLAAILLDVDPSDGGLYAVGTYGAEMFEQFFRAFAFRLALEYQTDDVRAEVTETATVVPLTEYTRNQVLC
jgi:arsenite oxidase small subunit